MIRYWRYMSVVIATFLLGLKSATEVKDPRRFLFDPNPGQHIITCGDDEELHCIPFPFICKCHHKGLIFASEIRDHRRFNHHDNDHQQHHAAIDGGWSAWSGTSCSTTCGDGVVEETRTCTNPVPMHGGNFCTGESTRHLKCTNVPCPTTAPQTINKICTSDLNCSSFTCPGHQHPYCEPYPEWSQCGCTECTREEHCSCPQGMIGNCRDDIFERICECQQSIAIDGGWSAWSSKSCSTTCGDGVREETRTCTNPAPMHGGNNCTGESSRQSNCTNGPCPTTAPQTINKCTSDLNCSSFTCPGHRHPYCEPYLEWSQCGCTECTRDEHCSCPQGMIGNCRDDIFERNCECQQLTGTLSHCTDDADCSTHKCTENLRQSFCHKNILLSLDLSTCDCRECSEDSHCHCQSGLIPHCESTTFGNACQCKQPHTSVPNVSSTLTTQTLTSKITTTETPTPSTTEYTTLAPSSTATEAITTTTPPPTTTMTTTTTTTTTPTPKSTTITTPSTTTTTTKPTTSTTTATTTGTSSVLSSETTTGTSGRTDLTLPVSSTEATKTTNAKTTTLHVTSSSTAQSVPEHSTTALSNITSSPTTPTVTTTKQPQKGKRKCHVCGDYDSQLSCDTRSIYLGNLQDCAVGTDYCMTDIIHDGGTYPSTYKRCVTEVECTNKWLHQTSDLDQCINYGNVIDNGQFSCHFCCTSDGCNSGQIPDKSTFYIKA